MHMVMIAHYQYAGKYGEGNQFEHRNRRSGLSPPIRAVIPPTLEPGPLGRIGREKSDFMPP